MSWLGRLWKKIEPHIVQDDPYPPALNLEKFQYVYLVPWPFKVEPRSIITPAQRLQGQERYDALCSWLGENSQDAYAMCPHVCSSGIYIALQSRNLAFKLRLKYDTVAVVPEDCIYISWYLYADGSIIRQAITRPEDLNKLVDDQPQNK
jgi:hypothetical protein